MMFYHFRKKVKRKIVANFNYMRIIVICFFTKPKGKTVFLEITEIDINRYLYNLIKFFKLNGYTIYIPRNKSLINKLCQKKGEFKYASWILNGDVKIGIPDLKNKTFCITKKQLSNDYFSRRFQSEQGSYYVPMSQYPLLYDSLKDEENIVYSFKRKRSVFMAGNFDIKIYNNISNDGYFEITSRREVADFIYDQDYYYQLKSFENLIEYIGSPLDFKVLLIDTTKDFKIKMSKLKDVLKEFDFFMALPGVVIPQSHNLIEAMAVGCIPIIHKTYANLFFPVLEHYQTAFVYENKQELDNILKEVFVLNEDEVILLRENVSNYYKKHLSPKAVVDTILNKNYSKIIIQAEHVSLNLLNIN